MMRKKNSEMYNACGTFHQSTKAEWITFHYMVTIQHCHILLNTVRRFKVELT